jgi:hypothetical protein
LRESIEIGAIGVRGVAPRGVLEEGTDVGGNKTAHGTRGFEDERKIQEKTIIPQIKENNPQRRLELDIEDRGKISAHKRPAARFFEDIDRRCEIPALGNRGNDTCSHFASFAVHKLEQLDRRVKERIIRKSGRNQEKGYDSFHQLSL